MATGAASSNSSPAAAPGGQGADDNYAPAGTTSQGASASRSATGASCAAGSEGSAPAADDNRLSEPLRTERRKSNQLEKEIRTLRQQLNRFSEINPEGHSRLQEAERQKRARCQLRWQPPM
jgi:hypothetical protein